jgi:flagellar motor switch protein FliM
VTSIEELSYDEYVRDIPIPTHLSILSLEPLPGVGIFQLPIDGAMAIVELLLGGQGRGVSSPDRPLSEIESSLIRTITDRGLRELAYAFESVIELHPTVIGIESNPQFAQLASPSDMVIVINFELRIGEVIATRVSLCYPYSTIKPLLSDMVGGPRSGADGTLVAAREQLAGRICDATVECSVQFQPATLRSHEILGLRVGDIVNLSHPHDALLTATVDGVPLFHVRPVRKGKRVAAQVVSHLNASTPEN